ncbi:hypothetical protein [Mesobacillus jeotgali]|uniref:hypothetical protein n=1 Tax=Mesobacillus jeotgali TaxID=129985 RepID=UPI002226EBE0|nr:hypothetical protein [Mesobacillus jeotgali]UYZ22814.1 hypothetical protein FOF60_04335 [Mesobacillus jeotgali]
MVGNKEKVSVIRAMTDRNRWKQRKSVRHQSDDGQKWLETKKTDRNRKKQRKSVRHQSDDGQKWMETMKNCPSSGL